VIESGATGTPRRAFLYVEDMADACIHLMKTYSDEELVNIGTGEDISIAEFAAWSPPPLATRRASATIRRGRRHAAKAARRQPPRRTRLARAHLAADGIKAGLSGVPERDKQAAE